MSKKKNTATVLTESREDNWSNAAAGLGVASDKRTHSKPTAANKRSKKYWLNLYQTDDVAQTVVDLPANEMTRKGFSYEQSDDDGVIKGDVLQKMDELNFEDALLEATTQARLYGGAGIFVGVNDGSDPSEPINETNIRSVDFLTVFDRHQLLPQTRYTDPTQANYKKIAVYKIQTSEQRDVFIHESRILKIDGASTGEVSDWGESVLMRAHQPIADFGIAFAALAHLIQDFSIPEVKIAGLKEAMASDNTKERIITRMEYFKLCKGIANIMLLDEREEYKRNTASVAGLDTSLDKMIQRLSQAVRIPVTLLMGQSPAGLNATGDSDIRWFYDNIASEQRRKLLKAIKKLTRLILLSKEGPTGGVEPDQWLISFNPLWQLTDLEQADVRLKTAQADALDVANGILDPAEVAMSRYGGDAYSTITKLDMAVRDGLSGPANLKETVNGNTPDQRNPTTNSTTAPEA